jgi:hypothetical protein
LEQTIRKARQHHNRENAGQRLAPSRFLRIKNTATHKNMRLKRRNVLRLPFQRRREKQQ